AEMSLAEMREWRPFGDISALSSRQYARCQPLQRSGFFPDEMGIDLHGDRAILMPQVGGHFGRWLPIGQEQACKRVPEPVRREPLLEPRPLDRTVKHLTCR